MVGVEPEEHRDRQDRARRAAAERGLRALVSFSRSGGVHDRIADALWLTGLATPQPFVPDLPGHWRATGHVVVVVPVDGPVTAVGAAAVARAVTRREHARVGVLGADAVPFAWWTALAELVRTASPDAALE